MRHWSVGVVVVGGVLGIAGCGGRREVRPVATPPARPAVAVNAPPAVPPPAPPAVPPPVAPWPGLDLGFEQVTGDPPAGWRNDSSYEMAVVDDVKHRGQRSLRLRSAGASPLGAALVRVPAAPVRGKHLALHGWIRTDGVKSGAAMFLRIEGGGGAVDSMAARAISGSHDWTEATAEVDVPEQGETVVFGPLLNGEGTAWFDDLRFEITEKPRRHPIVLAGTVVDAGGAPVAGAEVALVTSSGVDRHVRSDPDGTFRIDAVSGWWGFSVNHPGMVGSFLDAAHFDGDAAAIRLTLGATDGVVVHGTIGPAPPAPGGYVGISLISSHDGDSFAVPVRADGTFEATLPRADNYTARVIDGTGHGSGAAKRTGDRVEIAIALVVLAPPPTQVVDWIAAHAIPLSTTEAGHGLDDIAPITRLVGKAHIVALGEATHGTREFFQLKHRVLEYLVATQGFTVFAIEANQPECRALNDYVLHGTGDPRAGLDGIYFWTWNTEEVLAMIEWMRAWNADPKHRNKVQFLGFDMQISPVAYASVAGYLARVTPDAAPDLLAPIQVLERRTGAADARKLGGDDRKRLGDGLAAIAARFDTHRKAWTRQTGAAAFDDARHDVTILQQATALYLVDPSGTGGDSAFNVRDRSMANNIGWIVEHEPAGSRIVVWAHNGHIANQLYQENGMRNMGSHLRRRFQADYVNLGFVFSEGSFQAIEQKGGPRGELNEITLGPPPESHASVAFARTGKPLLVLDLRALPRRGVVHDWFAARHMVRDTGAVFSTEDTMTVPEVLPELYDAVIFVDRTTRARPNHPRG